MIITATIWDKQSPINGRDALFLSQHFKKMNGNDDRVLIAYDGVISRIEYLSDCFFNNTEKERMTTLIGVGLSKSEAIARVWEEKMQAEEDKKVVVTDEPDITE